MGMFDSFYATPGFVDDDEWQTKAYGCQLDTWHIGDSLPDIEAFERIQTYQVEVLGSRRQYPEPREFINSFATVSCGVLAAVPVDRDPSLPLFSYSGGLLEEAS